MIVTIEREQTTKEIQFTGSVKQLLEKLNINPETVLTIKNSEVLTQDEELENTDTIEILSVISGG